MLSTRALLHEEEDERRLVWHLACGAAPLPHVHHPVLLRGCMQPWQEHEQQQVPEEHRKELCGAALLSPCLPLSHARLWHELGSPLEAGIPGTRIQAAAQLRCGKKKKLLSRRAAWALL